MDIELQIVVPKGADDPVDFMLVEITKAISNVDEDSVAHGILGGEYGYGAHWKGDVFDMRPFFWGECDCGADERNDAWHGAHPHATTCFREILQSRFNQSDEESGYDAIDEATRAPECWTETVEETEFGTLRGSFRTALGEKRHKEWCRAYDKRNKAHERLTNELYDELGLPRSLYQWLCTCGVDELAKEYFATEGHYASCALELPNFRYHATGFEVRWYKYIGRGMEFVGDVPADLTPMLRDCLADIAAQGTSASGQDPKGLEAKPAGPVGEAHAPQGDRHD